MVALLVFIMATLEIVFGRKKKLLDGILGPFGGNVFKNPALGIETCFLSQRLLLLMTRKTIGHGLKVENILPFFFSSFNAMPTKITSKLLSLSLCGEI